MTKFNELLRISHRLADETGEIRSAEVEDFSGHNPSYLQSGHDHVGRLFAIESLEIDDQIMSRLLTRLHVKMRS